MEHLRLVVRSNRSVCSLAKSYNGKIKNEVGSFPPRQFYSHSESFERMGVSQMRKVAFGTHPVVFA